MAMASTACEPLASRSGVSVTVRSESGLPQLHLDRSRIAQVFQNLLENAIQHSAKGKGVLFRAERVEGDRDGVRFAVEDTGPGFLPNDLHRVFEPFFTRRRGGTGLGLSIVQRIVEQHGGEVLASNLAAGGAVMTVFLPLRPRRSGAASPHALAEMARG
jgi:signal transduction histidine kinase